MLDVYFYEAFAEEAGLLRELFPARFTAGYTDRTIQETGHADPPARVISIRTQSQIPVSWAPQLDAILSRSTGYDHLIAYASKSPRLPALGYLPLYCHRAVAEQAALLWMALLRRLPRQMSQFSSFHRDGLTGRECSGKVLAVVGVGNIGYEVCKIARGLEMRVLGVDVNSQHQDIEYVPIESALAQADVLVCAMDLNSTNRGYFDEAKWRLAKPRLVFVNVSRGELSPSTALLQALNAGQISGVGLDVYDQEAALAVSLRSGVASNDAEIQATVELSKRDDCICTPHNAFNSAEATRRKSEHTIEQLVAYFDHGQFLWTPPGSIS
jgi:D-lactate dehydrogenase